MWPRDFRRLWRPLRARGFATAAILGLLAVIALLSVGALHDALFGSQLAGTRALQQRAAALAELGIQSGMARLGASPPTAEAQFAVRPLDDSEDTVSVVIRPRGVPTPVPGFTLGRFAEQRYEIESTAHTSRNVMASHVQGVTRLVPQNGLLMSTARGAQ